MRQISLVLLLLIATACGTTSGNASAREVPLLGLAEEQRDFAGTWNGALVFDDAHRNLDEQVTFAILPGMDNESGRFVVPAGMPQSTLSYVRIDGKRMLSAVPPQFDRSCACTVYTTFEGELRGQVITGRVRRVEDHNRVVNGTLLVSRAK
jgi:hypothetical protein